MQEISNQISETLHNLNPTNVVNDLPNHIIDLIIEYQNPTNKFLEWFPEFQTQATFVGFDERNL